MVRCGPAENVAKREDRDGLAAEPERTAASIVAAIGTHIFCAFHVTDIAAAERESFVPDIATQDAVPGGARHGFFRAASNWPMRAGGATWSAPARSMARSGMLGTTQLAGSWTKPSPPASRIRFNPTAPSSPEPVRTIPIVAAPNASAADVIAWSIEGRYTSFGAGCCK
jgi:hypothetical protein